MHIFETEVFYEDTDMGGIVYHANYLKFIERARSALIRSLGLDQLAMRDREDCVFVVSRVDARFRRPARFEDRLQVLTRVLRIGGARISMEQTVRRAGTDLFRAEVDLAIVHMITGRPVPIPAKLRRDLQDLLC